MLKGKGVVIPVEKTDVEGKSLGQTLVTVVSCVARKFLILWISSKDLKPF